MTKAIICCGRDYDDRDTLFKELDELRTQRRITCVVHGMASGADSLAREWGNRRGLEVIGYPADWRRHGRAAGPIRNQNMLDSERPDFVIAFPGGRGTADMVSRATSAGVEVILASRRVSGKA